MSFSIASILWAALFGAIGGAIGGGLSQLIHLSDEKRQNMVRTTLIIVFVVLSYNLSKLVPPPFVGTSEVDVVIAELLEGETLFAYIAQDHPEIRPVIEDRLRAAYQRDGATGTTNEAALVGQELGGQYIPGYIPLASDIAIQEYFQTVLEAITHMAKIDPEICFHWLFGGKPDIGTRILVTPKQVSRMNAAVIALIKSSHDTSAPPEFMSDAEFQSKMDAIVEQIGQKYSDEDISFEAMTSPGTVQRPDDKRRACLTVQAFYREILEDGKEDSVRVFRKLSEGAGTTP